MCVWVCVSHIQLSWELSLSCRWEKRWTKRKRKRILIRSSLFILYLTPIFLSLSLFWWLTHFMQDIHFAFFGCWQHWIRFLLLFSGCWCCCCCCCRCWAAPRRVVAFCSRRTPKLYAYEHIHTCTQIHNTHTHTHWQTGIQPLTHTRTHTSTHAHPQSKSARSLVRVLRSPFTFSALCYHNAQIRSDAVALTINFVIAMQST